VVDHQGVHWSSTPRVTLGVATWNRDTYLAESIESGLAQTYEDFELLVVDDGSTNPRIAELLARYEDQPRVRVVRHPENRGIAAAYDTIVREGRGELIAMIGDDDVSLPDRLAREVAIFDAYPETGIVHGDALMIDARGRTTGRWESRDFTPAALVHAFYRSHNHLVDPSRMVHRRVYEQVGGYDASYRVAQDLHFWLRAARTFRFRHVPGGPVVGFRRHGENTSDESARAIEIDDVERALELGLELYSLRELVPELDWAVLDPGDAERQALERLAGHVERRLLPLPGFAAKLIARAQLQARAAGPPRRAPRNGRRLMMTAFGWNDSGGGTIVPRLAAKELARRGWDVSVFHAAVRPTPERLPYEVREWEEDGVHLIGVHNRAHGLWDLGSPLRELDDPPITAAFAAALDRVDPHVVHFHNLHNLGAALIDVAAARGLPSWFTTHNYWLLCPRGYLMTGDGSICAGPGDGARCAACVGSADIAAHARRLAEIRARATSGLTGVMAVSDAVRRTLLNAGYPAAMVDVVRQGMPHDTEIWELIGRSRAPGRVQPDALTVAFLGSAYPHKGPQLLVEAAQRTAAHLRVQIHGEVPERFAQQLRALDARGVVELCGSFAASEIDRVLAGVDVAALPSLWWDCAPLAAAECRAAGVPLVVPRLGGLAEAARDEVDGLVFAPLDAGDLARQLDRLASEPGLLERLQRGIEAPRAFSAYVDELEAYYAGVRASRAATDRVPAGDLAVRWVGDPAAPLAATLPGRVQHVGAGDAPLPHAADVELRDTWPPDVECAPSGRLVVVAPPGGRPGDLAPGARASLRAHADELWVADGDARAAWIAEGVARERVVPAPRDPAERLLALVARPPLAADAAAAKPRTLDEDVALRVLATPAWRSSSTTPERLPELLAQWCAATSSATSACLYLLADPAVDGTPEELEARVLGAAARGGAALEDAGDINLMMEPFTVERDAGLHAAADVYVPLHAACAGQERLARAAGSAVVTLDGDGLARRLAGVATRQRVA
jgi:glycosyltransferase involved in cell wall biosynthesis